MATLAESSSHDAPAVYQDAQGHVYYRASALGMCSKALIALRQGFTPMSPPAKMKLRYDDGHLHEPQILARLESEFGYPVRGHQDEVVIPIGSRCRIIGHYDGLTEYGLGDLAVVDAKTASQDAFANWFAVHGGADLQRLFPHYWWQMGAYVRASNAAWACLAVKNKNSGEMRLVWIPEQELPTLGMLAHRVLELESGADDDLPFACDKPSFPCPVWYIHEDKPVAKAADGSVTAEKAEEINALATAFNNAKREKARVERLERETREALVAAMGVKVGDNGKLVGDITVPVETEAFAKVTPYVGTSTGGMDWDRLREDHPEITFDSYKKPGSKYLAFRLTERGEKKATNPEEKS